MFSTKPKTMSDVMNRALEDTNRIAEKQKDVLRLAEEKQKASEARFKAESEANASAMDAANAELKLADRVIAKTKEFFGFEE